MWNNKFISRLCLIVISFTLFACTKISNSNQSQNTLSLESVRSADPAPEASPRPFDANLDIGVVLAGTECSELFIRNKDLKPDDEIQVLLADDKPQEKLLARVVGPNNCPRDLQSGIEEIVLDGDESKPSEYEISFADKNNAGSGFAVVSAKAKADIKKGVANLTASNLPTSLLFRTCSGNESYHMTVWQGRPLARKRVWYSYMSLSYETVPTCRPADFK